jgi:pyruvate-formate lyase-activating enzyme
VLMSDRDLLALQREGERHIGLSLTAACPMTCSHCAAATVPAREHVKVAMRPELIALFCAEMPALAERGIRRISLTGGEPILAIEAVATLARAARAAGIATTIVTGVYWGTTLASRRRTIAALPDVECWNLSWDRFHSLHVKLAHIVATARDILATGARVTLRVAIADELDDSATQLAAVLPEVEIAVQPVRPVGRAAAGLAPATGDEEAPLWPCLSTGPLVMPDGSARPCCSSMMEEQDHPFAVKTARDGLVALHQAWLDDPLLLMIRAIGFRPVLQLLQDLEPDHPLLHGTAPHPCDVCATLFRDPAVARRIANAVCDDHIAAAAREAAASIFSLSPPEPGKHSHAHGQ